MGLLSTNDFFLFALFGQHLLVNRDAIGKTTVEKTNMTYMTGDVTVLDSSLISGISVLIRKI